MDILKLIKTKIKEHQHIIDEMERDYNKIKNSLIGLNREEKLDNQIKLIVLKDRILFHKGSLATLNDLLKENKNEQKN